jgi:hypothetical protein
VGELSFYKKKDLTIPNKCKSCIQKKKTGRQPRTRQHSKQQLISESLLSSLEEVEGNNDALKEIAAAEGAKITYVIKSGPPGPAKPKKEPNPFTDGRNETLNEVIDNYDVLALPVAKRVTESARKYSYTLVSGIYPMSLVAGGATIHTVGKTVGSFGSQLMNSIRNFNFDFVEWAVKQAIKTCAVFYAPMIIVMFVVKYLQWTGIKSTRAYLVRQYTENVVDDRTDQAIKSCGLKKDQMVCYSIYINEKCTVQHRHGKDCLRKLTDSEVCSFDIDQEYLVMNPRPEHSYWDDVKPYFGFSEIAPARQNKLFIANSVLQNIMSGKYRFETKNTEVSLARAVRDFERNQTLTTGRELSFSHNYNHLRSNVVLCMSIIHNKWLQTEDF